MKKKIKKITKEWIEITLCDMLDEISYLIKSDKNKDRIMEIVKKYSAEIYNSQSYDKE